MIRFDTPTARLRSIACIEGISYLILLFVAMPLKYVWAMPMAVRVVGTMHGVLFVWLGLLTLDAMRNRGKPLAWGIRLGVASLVPFGTFFLDADLRADDEAYRERRSGV